MENHRLRAIILKLQDRLSNDDRKRLHFYLGNDVPRRIRDDPTLSGTLNLMDSLFDQDKVNEKDFTFLINAFDEIQCIDAVKLLREHWRHNQSDAHNQSVESLTMIMPPMINQLLEDQDEDKYSMQQLLVNQKNICGNNNVMINSNNTNINQIPIVNFDEKPQHSASKRKQLLNPKKVLWKCLLLFALLSIVGYGILAFFCIQNFVDLGRLKISHSLSIGQIQLLETSNNQSIETIQQLKHKMEQINKPPPLRSPAIDIYPNAKWSQNGVTVAGGNSGGSGINQLSQPLGLYVDDNETVYVSEWSNNRITEWKSGTKTGQVVAAGNSTYKLTSPRDVIVDKASNSLVICDRSNRRVVRWPRGNDTRGETIISNIDCWGLTMGEKGSLYVTDDKKHEVRRYERGESEGIVVAGGNEGGSRLDQLSHPSYVFVDRDSSVYVSDHNNHRVMKWEEAAKQGIIVAGGHGKGDNVTQLSSPEGVVVDRLGTVYVADADNARIIRWMKGAKQGNIIAGGNNRGGQSNQLNGPIGLSFDRHGNIYVGDLGNDRVQKFNLSLNE
ncbi:unnamed protein product [Adineta steineri]|uniref:DED domain-containing protein n=1 Tax=Adineta steineri TaxID=433720 RepID=A0A814ZZH0_9BILA|nr:unnamed protein product [Adineta steineri]CAF1349446.1 unnamed protein product [Adineta steineri]CAF1536204.1 unnamed protein product [Adineta steineri]CAF1596095.1 unnamed protein product [Adineta steineri]